MKGKRRDTLDLSDEHQYNAKRYKPKRRKTHCFIFKWYENGTIAFTSWSAIMQSAFTIQMLLVSQVESPWPNRFFPKVSFVVLSYVQQQVGTLSFEPKQEEKGQHWMHPYPYSSHINSSITYCSVLVVLLLHTSYIRQNKYTSSNHARHNPKQNCIVLRFIVCIPHQLVS
jgi:hypothetical protein